MYTKPRLGSPRDYNASGRSGRDLFALPAHWAQHVTSPSGVEDCESISPQPQAKNKTAVYPPDSVRSKNSTELKMPESTACWRRKKIASVWLDFIPRHRTLDDFRRRTCLPYFSHGTCCWRPSVVSSTSVSNRSSNSRTHRFRPCLSKSEKATVVQ